jgi:hypothetical protein
MRISDQFANDLFGISLGKIIGKRGNLSYKNIAEIKRAFGLPVNARIALIGTSPDQRLENLWKIHETHSIFERIAEMGFDLVTSLTYSVWTSEFPRPDQLRNHYRNLWTYDVFAALGIPCIPFLFPVEDIDFVNTAKWLADRPNINTIAVYARYYHVPDKFRLFMSFMKRLEMLVDWKIRFLVCGIGSGENIARLMRSFDCRFENSKMFEKTIHGHVCDSNLKYSGSILTKDDLFRINLAKNKEFCSADKPIIYLNDPIAVETCNYELMGLTE